MSLQISLISDFDIHLIAITLSYKKVEKKNKEKRPNRKQLAMQITFLDLSNSQSTYGLRCNTSI